MPISPHLPLGTRLAPSSSQQTILPTRGSVTRSYSADPGMKKRVTASVTFVAGANQLQAAAATFANFAAGDTVEVEAANLNNGVFLVTATDASTQLTVAGGVKNEGPITVTIRAI